jgi:hypothetical protein
MRLDNSFVYDFLGQQGVTYLHHANTLATSLSFLNNSRGLIEKLGLFQTAQDSDYDDKSNDVWDDVFFDTKDLHGHFPRQNLYGPVLFKYQLSLLLEMDLEIFITKNNPMFWKANTPYNERYFVSTDDLSANWHKYELQRKMVTLRKPVSAIPFEKLSQIILDDPQVIIYNDTELHKIANEALLTINDQSLANLVSTRVCANCFCRSNYLNQYPTKKLAKFFLPPNIPVFP